MIRFVILLVLATSLTNGQLNYEGNPFTEYTEYIAEESNLSEKSVRQNDAPINVASSNASLRPQKLYPIMEIEAERQLQQAAETSNVLSDKSQRQIPFQVSQSNATYSRQLQDPADRNVPVSTAQVALSNFLNSKTPEESRASLDHYLRSQQSPEDQSHSSNAINDQNKQSLVQLDGQLVSQIGQQQLLVPRQEQQMQLTSQINQAQLMPQLMPQSDQRQQLLSATTGQTYNYVGQPTMIQPMIRAPTGVVLGQSMLQPVPLMTPSFQARNDMITSAMWRERMRRIRGKPFAQPRIAPGLYKGPIAGKFLKLNSITIERGIRANSFNPASRIVIFWRKNFDFKMLLFGT